MTRKAILASVCVLVGSAVLTGQDQTGRIRPEPGPALQPLMDGPFTHRNLSLYILYYEARPAGEADYITLEEGIRNGMVKITEADRETVRKLLVTNNSDRPLFLQAGELVSGGKQDRTLQASLVIPPRSVDVPIPSFCVEKTRWSGGKDLAAAGQLAPRAVNLANQSGSQDEVWRSVSDYKTQARLAMSRGGGVSVNPKTSSVNEELSSPEFRRLTDEYERALQGAPDRFAHPVGVAYAVNGRITTVDVYQAGSLFRKLFPMLLRAAAAEAAADISGRHEPPSLRQAADFIASAWDGRKTSETLGYGNVFVRITNARTQAGQLTYRGDLVHSQILHRTVGPPPVPVPIPIPGPMPLPPRLPQPH